MKKLFLIACSILFALVVNTSSAEVSENWQWRLGDQFEEVATLVARYPVNGCKSKRVHTSVGAPYGPIGLGTSGRLKRAKDGPDEFIQLRASDYNEDCDPQEMFDLYFCRSNGELAAIDKFIWINIEKKFERYAPFDYDNSAFIGFDLNEHELLYSKFHPYEGTHFEVFHPESSVIRYSLFKPYHHHRSIVYHQVWTAEKGTQHRMDFELCPDGPAKIDPTFKPKFHSLSDVYWTYYWTTLRLNRVKSTITKCPVWFPERRAVFEDYWTRWRAENQAVVDLISIKAEQITAALNDPRFNKRFSEQKQRANRDMYVTKRECELIGDNEKIDKINEGYIVADVVDYLSNLEVVE